MTRIYKFSLQLYTHRSPVFFTSAASSIGEPLMGVSFCTKWLPTMESTISMSATSDGITKINSGLMWMAGSPTLYRLVLRGNTVED